MSIWLVDFSVPWHAHLLGFNVSISVFLAGILHSRGLVGRLVDINVVFYLSTFTKKRWLSVVVTTENFTCQPLKYSETFYSSTWKFLNKLHVQVHACIIIIHNLPQKNTYALCRCSLMYITNIYYLIVPKSRVTTVASLKSVYLK